MTPEVRGAVEAALGDRIVTVDRVRGGDINLAFAVEFADGRRVFVKTNADAPREMFPSEARGLGWLGEAMALPVPEVLSVSQVEGEGPPFLVLELLDSGERGLDFDERLGRGLARLHRRGAVGFGLDHDNFIGSLPQVNGATPTWPVFFRECRLLPQLRLAVDRGRASDRMRRGFERLLPRLEDCMGPPEPPARLHGDLWSGNVTDHRGAPVLIDPAAYGGHREVDLAMMRLFGGFSERCFSAYAEEFPLAPGHEERVPLHQLYPLLVHVNLFGGAYVASVERALGGVS